MNIRLLFKSQRNFIFNDVSRRNSNIDVNVSRVSNSWDKILFLIEFCKLFFINVILFLLDADCVISSNPLICFYFFSHICQIALFFNIEPWVLNVEKVFVANVASEGAVEWDFYTMNTHSSRVWNMTIGVV